MLKFFLDNFGMKVINSWWDSLHHPSGFAIRYVFWTSALVLLVVGIFAVDVPFKDKTLPQLYIANEVEQYRLHRNTEDWITTLTKKQKLEAECEKIKATLRAFKLSRWQLMGVVGMPRVQKAIEIEMVEEEIGDSKKKLYTVELALAETEHSLRLLIASR